MGSGEPLVPLRHQPPLPRERLILPDGAGGAAERLEMDALFVGAGPAGLAGAIELANLVRRDNESGGRIGDVNIAVLEKAEALGEHSLSGAVVNPRAFRELFPDLADGDFPFRRAVAGERGVLPTRGGKVRIHAANHAQPRHYVASICEVGWLRRAEAAGVNVFTGFSRRAAVNGRPQACAPCRPASAGTVSSRRVSAVQ
jgi:electron-transferring-flavoprotein dehydrogenase